MRLSTLFQSMTGLLVLISALACGGAYHGPDSSASTTGPASAPATSLVYTNPASTGWALVQDPSSTATRLVLNLVGPSGLKGRGVGFNLASDGSVKFHRFEDGNCIKDMGVFRLKLASPNLYETKYTTLVEPVLLVGGTKQNGQLLTVGIYQKDRRHSAQDLNAPLCQIAIDLPEAGRPVSGSVIPLRLVRARMIPEDLGTIPEDSTYGDWRSVVENFRMVDVSIAVGTLTAR